MAKFPIKKIRTIALVGQAGSGKTSLAEALLAKAGAIPAAGSIERGGTVCDYTSLEKSFKHSLKLAVASFEAQEHRIHLLAIKNICAENIQQHSHDRSRNHVLFRRNCDDP